MFKLLELMIYSFSDSTIIFVLEFIYKINITLFNY